MATAMDARSAHVRRGPSPPRVQVMDLGDFDEACTRCEACIAVAREAGTPQPMNRAFHNPGQIQRAHYSALQNSCHSEYSDMVKMCHPEERRISSYSANGRGNTRLFAGAQSDTFTLSQH